MTETRTSALLVVGGLAVGRRILRTPPPPPPTALVVSHSPPPARPPVETPRGIEVVIEATPSSAVIFVDDVQLSSNPFSGRFPSDTLVHRLRVQAPKHQVHTEAIRFDRDVKLNLSLVAEREVVVPPRIQRPASPQRPNSPNAPSATSAVIAPERSVAPAPPTREKPSYDRTDPWSN